MSSSEVAVRRPQARAAVMQAKLQYAHELADSGLLPAQYRRNPANVLWAVEYGEMLGLPPMAAMTGVHVIEGKPTASAGLISGLVRQAGHQLRVWGTNKSATCEIIRSDDPGHTFSVTWTLKRNADDNPSAEEAKLLGKDVWQKYPASMLKSRAITQCARDACEEVLFGLHYTAEELGADVDEDGVVVGGQAGDAQAPAAAAEDDLWYAGPSPEREWLAKALEAAPGHATLDAVKTDWQQSVQYVHGGKLAREEVVPLQERLRARIGALRASEPAEAEVIEGETADAPGLDPDDPWAQKVADLASGSEAEAALDEVAPLAVAGTMDLDRADRVETAIRARFPTAGRGEAEAA